MEIPRERNGDTSFSNRHLGSRSRRNPLIPFVQNLCVAVFVQLNASRVRAMMAARCARRSSHRWRDGSGPTPRRSAR